MLNFHRRKYDFATTKNQKARKQRSQRPHLENLEERILPTLRGDVIAVMYADWTNEKSHVDVPIHIASEDFTMRKGEILLGLHLAPNDGNTESLGKPKLLDSHDRTVRPEYQKSGTYESNIASITIASFRAGDYTLQVPTNGHDSGSFEIQIYLVGDASADQSVDYDDARIYRTRGVLNSWHDSENYVPEADANWDGRITSKDYLLWRKNYQVSTRLQTLRLDVTPTPYEERLDNGTYVATQANVTLVGITNPGATVRLEDGDDGLFDNGITTANAQGEFSFPVTLDTDLNLFQVRAEDSLGQQRTAFVAIQLGDGQQQVAPTVTITNPEPNILVSENFVITGEVNVGSSPVSQVSVLLNGTAVDQITLNSDGTFQYTTDLGAVGDGDHSFVFRATDQGGLSGEADLPFTLDATAPAITVNLDPQSDSDPIGDGITSLPTVSLIGTTEPFLEVTLLQSGINVFADGSGNYRFDDIPLQAGENRFDVQTADPAGNIGLGQTNVTYISCGFGDEAELWTTAEEGGSELGKGHVSFENGAAILREGDSFVVTLQRTYTVLDNASALIIKYDEPQFDTSADGMNDAFEIALLDSNGNSLVHAVNGSGDAFLNWSEGQAADFGVDVVHLDGMVTLNLGGLVVGTEFTVAFRLLNNDGDTNSLVQINCVEVQAGAGQEEGSSLTPQSSFSFGNLTDVDFSQLVDVTPSFQVNYEQTFYHQDRTVISAEALVSNVGTYLVDGPLLVGITNLSDPSIRVRNATGVSPDGIPYYDFSHWLDNNKLNPGAISQSRQISFFNPEQTPFNYDVIVWANLNDAPVFLSEPDTEALVGRVYQYDATAIDADGDSINYQLLDAPAAMQIDPGTGMVTWTPTEIDEGSTSVTIEVSDGRGGVALQQYTLIVDSNVPNRPPQFTSFPVVEAEIDSPYIYQSQASDADGDALTYSLLVGPDGMTIDSVTGEVTWTPTASNQNVSEVTLEVSDGQGGTATQSFTIFVKGVAGNAVPVIISEPITAIPAEGGSLLATEYRYDVDAIDPDGDPLTYSLVTHPEGMTIDANTGLIQWTPPDDIVTRDSTTFTDSVLDASGWEFVTFKEGSSAVNSGVSVSYRSTGGNPDSYRAITISIARPNNIEPTRVWSIQIFREAVYDPRTQGALNTIDYSEDAISFNNADHFFAPIIRQNGYIYFYSAAGLRLSTGNDEWRTFELPGLRPEDFSLFQGSVPEGQIAPPRPDFSSDGGLIEFGTYRSVGVAAGGGAYTSTTGLDNVSVTFNPLPEADVAIQVSDGFGGVATQEFALQFLPPSTIRGFSFLDADSDGHFQRDEELLVMAADTLRYDQSNDTFIAPLSDYAGNAAFGPDGNLYLSYSGGARKIDPATGEILLSFDLEGNVDDPLIVSIARGMTVGPNGHVYIGGEVGDSIVHFDGTTGEYLGVFAEIPGLNYVSDMTFGPDGNLYVVGFRNRYVYKLDGSTGERLGGISVNPAWHVEFGPNGRLFVSYFNFIYRIDLGTGQRTTLAQIGSGEFDVRFDELVVNPDGDELYTYDSLNGNMMVLSPETGDILRTYPLNVGGLSHLLFTPEVTEGIESPIGNRTIFLDLNRNGRRDDDEPVRVTDENGEYNFTGLAAGTYRVVEEAQPGWLPTSPENGFYEITVGPGETAHEVNFGVKEDVLAFPNTAPEIFSQPPQFATIETEKTYQAEASDIDDDPLIYRLLVKPAGMSVNATTGLVTWTPTPDQLGEHEIVLQVDDSRGGTDLQRFTIEVIGPENRAPFFITEPVTTFAIADELRDLNQYRYDADAVDPNDDVLTYTLNAGPDGMTIDEATGQITWDPPQGFGTGLLFDGVDDFVDVPHDDSLNLLGDYTVSAWVRPDAPGDGESATILAKRDSSNNDFTTPVALFLEHKPAQGIQHSLAWTVGDNNNTVTILRINDFFTGEYGQWVNIALVMDGSQMRVYKNGTLQATETYTGTRVTNNASLEIGAYHSSGTTRSSHWHGAIDEVRIWNIARTGDEIQTDMKRLVDPSSTNLVGYWRFDEGEGTVATDLSPSQNHGVLGSASPEKTDQPIWFRSGNPSNPDILGAFSESIVFYDGTMRTSDWTLTEVGYGRVRQSDGKVGGEVTYQQMATAGNPGESHLVTAQHFGAPAFDDVSGVYGALRRSGAMYNPATQGAIYSLDFSLDVGLASTLASTRIGLALFQDGEIYVGPSFLSDRIWQRQLFQGITQSSFRVLDSAFLFAQGSKQPDFSENGGVIEFGYYVSTGSSFGSTNQSPRHNARTDNWMVRINRVPRTQVDITSADGRNGTDQQSFSLDGTPPAAIHGYQFIDVNRDEQYNYGPTMLVYASGGAARFDPESGALFNKFSGLGGTYMTVGPDGNVYTTTGNGGGVDRYDSATGEFLGEFIPNGTLRRAVGIAFGPDNNLYVSQDNDATIHRFDGQTGEYLDEFVPSRSGGLNNPENLTFGPDGNLYVANGSGSVLRYNGITGAFGGTFASGSTNVFDLEFGPDGNLYVTDYQNHRIRRLNGATGAYINDFVTSGSGGLRLPYGLAFGPQGDLYVSSASDRTVRRYDGITGEFISLIDHLQSTNDIILLPGDGEPKEAPLPGRTVYLDLNRNGRRDEDEPFRITDENGGYEFRGLAAGTYRVAEERVVGFQRTTPDLGYHEITVAADETVHEVNFGQQQLQGEFLNREPTFVSTPPENASVGSLLVYDALAVDANGDPLTYNLAVGPKGMQIDPLTGRTVWRPQADQLGQHDVIIVVNDGRGGLDLQDFQIQVNSANTPPVITSNPGDYTTIGHPFVYQVVAQDAENDTITFPLATGPDGMAIDPDTGLLQYTPRIEQLGLQTISIVATDDQGGSTTQTFELNVIADAGNTDPQIVSEPRLSIGLGRNYVYQVLAIDEDSDPLTYSLNTGPIGMTLDAVGLLQWSPTSDQIGVHAVSLAVTDGRGGESIQSFSIEVTQQNINNPPVISSLPVTQITAGQTYRYDAIATDSENDPIFWTLAEAPAGMSLGDRTGTLRWVPTLDQIGEQRVRILATDAQGGIDEQSFTITVRAINTPPVIVSAPVTRASLVEPYSYTVSAIDRDGDDLEFTLQQAPIGMSIDAQSGLIQWTPLDIQLGVADVVVHVNDGNGGVATQSYQILVTELPPNRPPQITSNPDRIASIDSTYSYAVSASDPDGDILTYSLVDGPAGAVVDPDSGLLQWSPDDSFATGRYPFHVSVQDPDGLTANQRFEVNLLPPNHAPTIPGEPLTRVIADTAYRYDVQAVDPDGDPVTYALLQGPDGLTLDFYGRMRWQPTLADLGVYPIEIRVTDFRGSSVTLAYDLEVIEDTVAPEVLVTVSENPIELGQEVVFVVQAVDEVRVESLTLTVNGMAVPLDDNGRYTYLTDTPGFIAISATATDPSGNVGEANGTLTVIDPSDTEAPVVSILSPTDGDVITSIVDVIGTVQDDNLLFYSIAIAPVNTGQYRELARGADPVIDGVLGRLDASVLANDVYDLRLYAVDAGGNESTIVHEISISGELKLGNFQVSFVDLAISVSGVPITVTRSYDSLNANQADDLGYGWRLEIRDTKLRTNVPETGLEEDLIYKPFFVGARVYVTLPGGKREGFTFQPKRAPGLRGSFLGIFEPAFIPDSGVTSQLNVQNFDLSVTSSGDLYAFASGLPYNPVSPAFGGDFTLTTNDGLAYVINGRTGQMEQVIDPNDNTLTFTDAGILSSSGQSVEFERDAKGRITAVIDPMGNRVEYEYSPQGDLIAVTDREGHKTELRYDEPSRPHYLTEIIDPLGRSGIRNEYDDQGRLVKMINSAGDAVELIHDPENFVETIIDPLGNPTIYEYDPRGNVVKITDAEGGTTSITYDDQDNILTTTDSFENTTAYTYDNRGNVLTTTDALGNTTRYKYQNFSFGTTIVAKIRGLASLPFQRQISITDPLGHTRTREHDFYGNLIAITDPTGVTSEISNDGFGNLSGLNVPGFGDHSFENDSAGNLLKQTDALGQEYIYTYDANGNKLTESTTRMTSNGIETLVTAMKYDRESRLIEMTDPEGNRTFMEYDAVGNLIKQTDPLGRITHFVYDAKNLLIETILPDATPENLDDNPRVKAEYDAAGRVIAQIDEGGRRVEYRYDKVGRRTEVIYPDETPEDLSDNPRTRVEYDLAGRVFAEIDELGQRTEYEYDALGRQIIMRNALGYEFQTKYDAAGRVIAQIDPLGRETKFEYDAANRPIRTIFVDGTATVREYDDTGRPVVQIDQAGNQTKMAYDGLGRLASVTDAHGNITFYEYDEFGNLISRTDANGHVTRTEYDKLGRPVATILPMGQISKVVYDAVGNIIEEMDFNGETVTYEYDERNRLLAKNYPDGSSTLFSYGTDGLLESITDSRGVTLYEYNVRGRLVSRTEPDQRKVEYAYNDVGNITAINIPSGTMFYSFDVLNRIESVTDYDGETTHYIYNPVGALVETQLPNGTVETKEYDSLNRLVFQELKDANGTILQNFRYTLNEVGFRTRVEEHNGRTVNYAYDELFRLIGEDISDPDLGDRDISYTFDPVGNRLTRNDSIEGLTTYQYDDNDQLIWQSLASVGTTNYIYDNNGNLISKDGPDGSVAYQWDVDNHLIAADRNGDGDFEITNTYNASGLRVAQNVNGEETRFLLDDGGLLAQVLEEYTPEGDSIASYVHGSGLISQSRSDEKVFFHADGLGSTRSLTNDNGEVVQTYLYDAYGRPLHQSGSTANDYQFAGEQRDGNLGLDYLRARYMDPDTGRFLSRDEFSGVLMYPTTLHKYMYANANPVNYTDPTGYFSLLDLTSASAINKELQALQLGYTSFDSLQKAKNFKESINFYVALADWVSVLLPILSSPHINVGEGNSIQAAKSIPFKSPDGKFSLNATFGSKLGENKDLLLLFGFSGNIKIKDGLVNTSFGTSVEWDPRKGELRKVNPLSGSGTLTLYEKKDFFTNSDLIKVDLFASGTVSVDYINPGKSGPKFSMGISASFLNGKLKGGLSGEFVGGNASWSFQILNNKITF